MQRWIVIILFVLNSLVIGASVSEVNANYVTCKVNNEECSSCPYTTENTSSGATTKVLGLVAIIGLASYYLYSINNRKLFLVLGGGIISVLISSSFIKTNDQPDNNCIAVLDTSAVDEFRTAGDEFQSLDNTEFQETNADEFKEGGDEFSAASGDEFSNATTDDFQEFGDSEFSETTINNDDSIESAQHGLSDADKNFLIELSILFILTIIVGLFINNSFFQKSRPFFMLAMLIWLGFIHGGCPCMISSFQNLVLAGVGVDVNWISLLWFIGLLPLTYFLGRVWCGWLCHLGALQDFIFSATRIEILKKQKHQKILRIIQVSVFVLLFIQLAVTRMNIYIHYDPFKVAFNLFSANITGYVLLVLLLISSVLIYRPFCRAICPVGLVLGWISMLPKARKITQDLSCVDCVKCSNTCRTGAILYEDKKSFVSELNCIACGDCLKSCKKEALSFNTMRLVSDK